MFLFSRRRLYEVPGVGLVGNNFAGIGRSKPNGQMYRQCVLTKPLDGGTAYMVSWIRSQLAVIGKVLDKLEDAETGRLEYGWKVIEASEQAMPEGLLIHQAHNYDRMKRISERA